MDDSRTRVYVTIGFIAGVLLTLGFKDVYPDLERRFRRKMRRYSATHPNFSTSRSERVHLKEDAAPEDLPIPVGIEGCIGNTPLFKIRSLSEATGCEILGKAEVLSFLRMKVSQLISYSF
jgi:cysteine synthase